MPEPRTGAGPSLAKRALAVAILLVAAYVLLKVVIGLVSALLWPALAVLALVAVVWSMRVLR